jgi:hypothetical protein
MAGSKGTAIYSASVCIILICCLEMPLIFSQAAEILSHNESCLSFWGEKLDEQVEGLIKNYSEEVYKDLSHFSRGIEHSVSFLFFSFIQYKYPETST